jgi:hypothetical protein
VLKKYRWPLSSSVQIVHPAGSAISALVALARVKAANLLSFLGSMKNEPPPELPPADAACRCVVVRAVFVFSRAAFIFSRAVVSPCMAPEITLAHNAVALRLRLRSDVAESLVRRLRREIHLPWGMVLSDKWSLLTIGFP